MLILIKLPLRPSLRVYTLVLTQTHTLNLIVFSAICQFHELVLPTTVAAATVVVVVFSSGLVHVV